MRKGLVSQGVRAGLWAAVALIAWYTAVDVVRGQPLATFAYMSGLIFSYTTALPATARVLAFIAILFATYALVGMITNASLHALRRPPSWYVSVVIGAAIFVLGYLLGRFVFGVNLPRALGWFASVVGDLLTGIVIIAYLRRRRVAL